MGKPQLPGLSSSSYLKEVVASFLPASGPNPKAQMRLKEKWVTVTTSVIFPFVSSGWINLGWTKQHEGLSLSVCVEGIVRRGSNAD